MKFNNNPILFSQYRSTLMGISIIWIFIFHSGDVDIPIYDNIRRFGSAGVDIFFFLSALGLSFSLENNNDTLDFLKRRAKRIIPTWLTVLFCVHLLGLLCNHFLPSLTFHVPHSILQSICWYTGIGFFISDFVSQPLCFYYEWYVPSLLFFYSITPFLFKQKTKVLVFLFFASIVISYILFYFNLLSNLGLFYFRIPAFFMGILFYRIISLQWKYYPHALCCSFILGVICCILRYDFEVIIPQCFVVQLLMPSVCLLLIFFSKKLSLVNIFNFFGSISLELYLVHIYNRPQYLMRLLFENKLVIVILTFVLCTIVAVLLHNVIKHISVKIVNVLFSTSRNEI